MSTRREDTHPADDPIVTAYALGELEESERAAVETRMAADPRAAQAVAEVRRAAEQLEEHLAAQSAPGLTDAQRERIEGAARDGGQRVIVGRFGSGRWKRVAAAASVVMVVGIGALLFQRRFAAPGEEWLAARRASPGSGAVTLGRAERASTAARYGGRTLTTKGAPAPSSESIIGAFSVEGEAESFGHVTDGLVDDLSGEAYDPIDGNPFLRAGDAPLSTFSVDVDTASYSNVRRWISDGSLPPADAVRVEELVNYFPYDYAGPDGPHPFATHVEVAGCPWEPRHRLVRIGIKGREIDEAGRKPSNLVFLLDVSGSMNDPRKLPLLKSAMGMLTEQLGANDRVAIAVYAGAAGLVLVPTPADNRWAILEALERLEAGGSTAGAAGIELAYEVAREHFIVGGNNRVILCTDGDFNVGVAADGSLVRLIEKKAQSGVFLTVLGFGTGNLKDAKMEKLADKGNGNYAYIDSRLEARKVLVEQMGATLETIAKDVKVQVEFNPLAVEGYRLIGYENRLLAARDFADDTKDAGEIGAGHTVTALYEVVPVGAGLEVPGLGPLRYQENGRPTNAAFDGELLFVKLRYKEPEGDESTLIEVPVSDAGGSFFEADGELRFAASVAAFGMLLRGSQHLGKTTLDEVADWALESTGDDPGGYRAGFLELIAATGELRKE